MIWEKSFKSAHFFFHKNFYNFKTKFPLSSFFSLGVPRSKFYDFHQNKIIKSAKFFQQQQTSNIGKTLSNFLLLLFDHFWQLMFIEIWHKMISRREKKIFES